MSITKQLHINRIQLPKDLLNEIKDLCFYDITTAINREKKKYFIRDIKENATTIVNPVSLLPNWNYAVPIGYYIWSLDEIQIQVVFCKKCGNYKHLSHIDSEDLASPRTKCVCFTS